MTRALREVEHVFIDFDSTLVAVEGLEVLARVIGRRLGAPEATKLERQVEMLTELAMAGQVGFGQALQRRILLLRPTRADVEAALPEVTAALQPDAAETVRTLQAAGKTVAVLSGGVRPLVEPVALSIGVPRALVLCNDLVFDGDRTVGVDTDNPLSQDGGKASAIRATTRGAPAVMVGDGATDLEARTLGAAAYFVAHVGIRRREPVASRADHVIEQLSDLIGLLT